jgi:hypothetical protein
MAQFTGLIPAPNQTNVSRTTLVGFTILEQPNGAQINTLAATIDGYQAISAGNFVNNYTGKIFASTGKWVVGIYPKPPDFVRGAASIAVHMEVRDGYNNLDAYDYVFFTAGYNPPPPEPIPSRPTRPCMIGKPFFPPTDLGLVAALDEGTGTEVELNWKQAYPHDEDNVVFYNVYYSNKRANVFDGYPEFIVENTTTTIGGIAPGDQLFFGVRVAEFVPNLFTTTGLEQAGTDMFFYPDAYVDGYVSPSSLIISASSVSGFPDYGILRIGDELITYSAKLSAPPRFVVRPNGRGYEGTGASAHGVGRRIFLYSGKQDGNTIIASAVPTFQKPNYAIAYVGAGEGCRLDGYRDGYDGYATVGPDGYIDGYLRFKENSVDSLTTDGKNNDESGNFKRFDYCGSYRTHSPEGFMENQCTGTYWGGVQLQPNPTNPSEMVRVRVPDVRTHMLQREELLLETTGEPFVLVRRMWTGARCFCFMQRSEQPNKRCPICYGTGFTQGYTQFFNPRRPDRRILVRIDPATDDLNIVDRGGLEPEYEPSGWTLPFPAIKDRDVLIRFNPDNTEAWRYFVLNVTRNKAFFTQTGAQKLTLKRVPKTDLIYQFPVTRDARPLAVTHTTSVNAAPAVPAHSHSIVVSQGTSLATLKTATLESEGHNHVIFNGVVQEVLNHTHTIIIT